MAQGDMRGWPPYKHIDEACDILEAANQHGPDSPSFESPELHGMLAMAKVHVDIANAKMMGGRRA